MNLVDAIIILAYKGKYTKDYYGDAVQIIWDGEVKINQEFCFDPNRKLKSGEVVEWQSIIYGSLQYIVPKEKTGEKIMIPVKPFVDVPNDDSQKTMWNNGYILGYSSKNRVLWAFGFTLNSIQSKAYGLSIKDTKVLAVLADECGKVIKKQKGLRNITKSLIIPNKPHINVPNDDTRKAMWHNGHIKGYTKKWVVWSFGFEKDSKQSKVYGVYMKDNPPLFVLTNKKGKVVKKWNGPKNVPLPERIQMVLNSKV